MVYVGILTYDLLDVKINIFIDDDTVCRPRSPDYDRAARQESVEPADEEKQQATATTRRLLASVQSHRHRGLHL
jgi:hypothetical protein